MIQCHNDSICLLHSQQFHIKNQRGIGRNDSASASTTVGKIWRDSQLALAADFHARDALVPAFNYLARAQRELKWMPRAYGTVELLAVRKPAGVVDFHFVAGGPGCAGANFDVPVLQAGSCFGALASDLGWDILGLGRAAVAGF